MTPGDKRYIALVVERARDSRPVEEQRAATRHPFRTEVEVTPLLKPGGDLRPYLRRKCPTIDISLGGVRLLWVGAEPPRRVIVRFDGPEGPKQIESQVAWSRVVSADRVELGLQFMGKYPCFDVPEAPANDPGGIEPEAEDGASAAASA